MILQVNSQSEIPIYMQLHDQIILGIASKQILPGEVMPSVRRLAADLGINLHTVNKVYSILCNEDYLVMDRRKGAIAKIPERNEDFSLMLEQKLEFVSAEARCRGISEDEFIAVCLKQYRKSGESEENTNE